MIPVMLFPLSLRPDGFVNAAKSILSIFPIILPSKTNRFRVGGVG
jgi:hypothetical protein